MPITQDPATAAAQAQQTQYAAQSRGFINNEFQTQRALSQEFKAQPFATAQQLQAQRAASLDKHVNDVMQAARNQRAFQQNQLKVPSESELKYRMQEASGREAANAQVRPATIPDSVPTSLASAPATPRTSGANVPSVPGDTPMPAAPRTPTPTSNPLPGARIPGIPNPAGVNPVFGSLLDAGFRAAVGQPPGQIISGTLAHAAGEVIFGAAAGALLGPAAIPLGASVGGLLGDLASDTIWNKLFPPSTEPTRSDAPPSPSTPSEATYKNGILVSVYSTNNGHTFTTCCYSYYTSRGAVGGDVFYAWPVGSPKPAKWGNAYDSQGNGGPDGGVSVNADLSTIKILSTGCGLSQPLPPQPGEAPKPDRATPRSIGAGAALPPPAVPNPNYPADGTPRGDNPNFIPHAGLAPQQNPNPSQTPSNLGGNLPQTQPSPAPAPQAQPTPQAQPSPTPSDGSAPDSPPAQISTPSSDNNDRAFPQFKPAFSPTPLSPSAPFTPTPMLSGNLTTPAGGQAQAKPSALPRSSKPSSPTPDRNKPSAPPVPSTTPDSGILKQLQDNQAQINTILTALAALTIAVRGMPKSLAGDPDFQQAAQNAAAAGTCKTTQPGGCTANQFDGVNQNINALGSKVNGLGAGLSGANLGLLNVINNKLGEQVEGGLSGFLGNFAKWFHLDRLLNILTFIVTVQNALFLVDGLKAVTLQLVSDGLSVIGINDKDGHGLNLNQIIDKELEDVFKGILGDENWTGLKQEWKALSRIYQAATNIMFAMQNLFSSVFNALNTIGSWVAQIGDALKKYGVVGQLAYGWMNIQPNFHNKFFTGILNTFNVVTSLDFVFQSILQGRQTVDGLDKQYQDLQDALANKTDGTKPPEHKAAKDAADKAQKDSKSPAPSQIDLSSLQQP